MDERWPVLVGVGEMVQRDGALDPAGLMREALVTALADARGGPAAGSVDTGGPGSAAVTALGAPAGRPLPAPDLVLTPRGMWAHPDPGRAAALAVGSTSVRSIVAEIGVLQTTLFQRAFAEILDGTAEVVAIVGGEARYRSVRGGVDEPGEGEPDEVLRPHDDIITQLEVARGLGVPAHQYALIESALAHRAGRTPLEQTAALGSLWALGAEAAASNPGAWRRDAPSAAAIAGPDGGNRMIATPYRKWLVSDWNVDQAVAFVVTSAAAARAAGIPEDRWLVPTAAAVSNHMVPLSERDDIARCPAMEAIGAALRAVGAPVADADLREIYSCFPSAVQLQSAALGIDPWTGWTVSGGMTFGGGPLNNFVLQSTAAVARALRAGQGRTALVTAVSGMITKVGVLTWQLAPEAAAATPPSPTAAVGSDRPTSSAGGSPTVSRSPDASGPPPSSAVGSPSPAGPPIVSPAPGELDRPTSSAVGLEGSARTPGGMRRGARAVDGLDRTALAIDVTEEAARLTARRSVDASLSGPLTVVAQTVVHDRGEPVRAIVFAESAEGVRTIATSSAPEVLATCAERDLVGTTIHVTDGAFALP